MANVRDVFLLVAVAIFGAYAMIGFTQLNECKAQIYELNHLCRVQMDELKEIADTTECGKIIKIIGMYTFSEIAGFALAISIVVHMVVKYPPF